MASFTLKTTLAAAGVALSLTACGPQLSGDVVSANQAQVAQSVSFGVITGSRPVTVEGNRGGAAAITSTLVGGIAGAALGNEVGRGRGQDLATGAGAIAGATAGNQIAAAATRQESTEWFVRIEGSGQTISVIQASPAFSVGQRVQVIQSGDGTTRLQP
jgi:outer membrane lipoprotein SlyB